MVDKKSVPGVVLVIEDDSDVRDLIRIYLEMDGITVLEASDGAMGLEMACDHLPHLILLDIMMDDLDGYDTCKLLKQDPCTSDIPVVFLSARVEEADMEKGLSLGALDFVVKPFNTGILLPKVKTFISLRKTQIEIKKNEEKYKSLFESSQDALMTLEPSAWNFTSGNSATVRMFLAKNEADFVSHSPWQLSPEKQADGRDSSSKAVEMIEIAMRTGTHYFEWTHRRLNGESFPATVLLTRMNPLGMPFLQATVRDISELKKNEEQLSFQSVLLNNANDAIHALDSEGKILYVNDTMVRITGYSREELLGKSIAILNPPSDATQVPERIQGIMDKGSARFTVTHIRKDGATYPVEVYSHSIVIGGKKILIAIDRDISQRRP